MPFLAVRSQLPLTWFQNIGLVSPTTVPFTSVPLGKTTFQITTSVGRSLQTYDLRRGLQLVFLSRPQCPDTITTTCAYRDFLPRLLQMLMTNQSIRSLVLSYIACPIYSPVKCNFHLVTACPLCHSRSLTAWSRISPPLAAKISVPENAPRSLAFQALPTAL